ncbi:thiolase family protein [Virgibacillus sp. AGTR]|uniref:thiolase family protein n=1 Tax=unclassified Virgibacillus TaxID=2620237 RepID=UPI001962CFF8|nr:MULTISPECIES: thiolase family protein [unclassified Virgibacillus]MCC2252390.1 thiolase family protein [Virgibacillus sp. AGTR]MDY7045121.1 thiolase family protein [Virgibacillus sp. M23]QRZ19647.1 thiolase family protein [Virgibacillus sp. AGTR]
MREVVIVEGCRTAVGRRKGALKNYRSDELAAIILEELVKRAGVKKDIIEDVILGCVTQCNEQAGNIARTAALIAGFPVHVPGVTIDRQCGSSQQAVHFAAQAIASGDMEVVIAGGVESMTRAPMFSNVGETKPSNKLTANYEIVNQGVSAEKIAQRWHISRDMLDAYALRSHKHAIHAVDQGRFQKEIVPIHSEEKDSVFDTDEGPRRDTTLEALAKLKAVFMEEGRITAGNSSQMSDGASAVLLMSKEKAAMLGLEPRAKIIARTVIGSDPTLMLTGPIAATKQALNKASLSIDDIDRYEVNEAFASIPIAWLHDLNADQRKLNVNGGAIALGHPLGATGTKLLVSLLHELERIQGQYGLVAICEGMGMANATIIERL